MSVAVAKLKMKMMMSTSPPRGEDASGGDCGGSTKVVHLSSMGSELKKEEPKDIIQMAKVKAELNSTPRTEASTPDSRDGTLDVDDEDHDVAINQVESDDNKKESPEREVMEDEMPMSQTDQHIHQLDRDGELNEVAGSQSMLSQELIYDLQNHHKRETNASDEEDEDGKNSVNGLVGLHLSQETESSIGMAKRIGLLSMTQEEEEQDSEEDTKLAAVAATALEGPHTPKRPASRLSMLSRGSSTGAPDLASFSAKKAIIAAENKLTMDISDTPVRESEGFGSLLDAVAKITEQEESEEGEDSILWRRSSYLIRHPEQEATVEQSPTRRKKTSSSRQASLSPTRTSPRKPTSSHPKRKIPMAAAAAASSKPSLKKRKTPLPVNDTTTKKKKSKTDSAEKKTPTPKKITDDTKEARAAAIRAAALAERIVTDPGLAKQLLLSMALVRENPRSAPEKLPGPGHVLPDGFVWARYPPLENVLKKHMAEYYQLSTEKCQSAQQQAFNNDMVVVVREVAEELKWEFAGCFDDRALRDRIRCYYKTHIQNAKKRLRTMVRNPTKRANSKHLLQHLDIIEKAKVEGEKVKQKKK